MGLDLVGVLAGDREMTASDRERASAERRRRGGLFYPDLLFAVCHRHFPPRLAKARWWEILAHKRQLSDRLGRDVRVAVATLDYLSNVTGELRGTTLISEASLVEIAGRAMRDGLTGLFNHSTCYELLDLELTNYRRYGTELSILLLDIDDFKVINDHAGHKAGNRVLVELAMTLEEEAREGDTCCRLGGDEFMVILRHTGDPVEACRIAERIRGRAAGIACQDRRIAISVGVAACSRATRSSQALVERADRALREAKRGGKDRAAL